MPSLLTRAYQLQSGQVPGQGANTGPCPESSVFTARSLLVYELVRLCSFGSIVLWISLRPPSDLLYRSNSVMLKVVCCVGSLVFAQLLIANNSRRGMSR